MPLKITVCILQRQRREPATNPTQPYDTDADADADAERNQLTGKNSTSLAKHAGRIGSMSWSEPCLGWAHLTLTNDRLTICDLTKEGTTVSVSKCKTFFDKKLRVYVHIVQEEEEEAAACMHAFDSRHALVRQREACMHAGRQTICISGP